jgi:hypothetical protein
MVKKSSNKKTNKPQPNVIPPSPENMTGYPPKSKGKCNCPAELLGKTAGGGKRAS